ncbi:hypothetical protein WOLCODRAFT_154157 [Wolfiporia cocos MD-104 SS10]|uniref:F-box domain-containing protein n=1 Tax=Wolfiporia cocos (strain MD-104) TaxID=742152 RepID=A0A2H3JPL4_WOLCO|nr:hypothetical protein WOLCODRAFT_154157 [Wolfiporia cocos MD-104 SS10]
MSDEMEGEPAASCVNECAAFNIEARVLRDIEWRLPKRPWELVRRRDALLPVFNSETAASRIPIGIWDKILGHLADEPKPETLGIAEEMKGCYSMEDVCLYARYIKIVPRRRRSLYRVILRGRAAKEGSRAGKCSIAHVGTDAAMFAGGQLPCLAWLCIEHGEWTPGTIAQSVFLHLSSFHSITFLRLEDITLPSVSVLLRLVCALDCLEELHIGGLRLLDRRVPPASRRWAPSPGLKKLAFRDLDWPDELRTLFPRAELETSSGSATILFLWKAVGCSNLQQLLDHAGKALRSFWIHPLRSLLGANPHSIQPLRVLDVDLSRNTGLRELWIDISESHLPPALLERSETYGVIQRMISSTCPTILEKIMIQVSPNPSAASPSIMSHVLLALRRALCPADHPVTLEKYISLKSVKLYVYYADETSKKQIEADWANLAPIWFPSLYSRAIIK